MGPPHRRAECLGRLSPHQPQLKTREYSSRHRRQGKKQICPHLAPSAPYEHMDQCQGEIDRREYWPNSGDPAHSVLTGSTVRSSLNLERPVAVLRTLFSTGRLVTCLFSRSRGGNRGTYWYTPTPVGAARGCEIGDPELLTFDECARKMNHSLRELRRPLSLA